jgi:hypothetical protein
MLLTQGSNPKSAQDLVLPFLTAIIKSGPEAHMPSKKTPVFNRDKQENDK